MSATNAENITTLQTTEVTEVQRAMFGRGYVL